MSGSFKTYKLSDHPKYIETCAVWDLAQWGAIEENSTYADKIDYYKDNIANDGRPETLVGTLDNKIICMATLKETEHPDRKDLSPWIGDVFVQHYFRKKGYGHKICQSIETLAKETYGFDTLYLQTRDPEFYLKAGWLKIGTVRDTSNFDPDGETLMKKDL